MKPGVQGYLERAATAPQGASALEAVMGEDWATLKLGDPAGAARLEALFGSELARERRRSRPAGTEIVKRAPQAMVKLVGRGGAADRRGLRAQMTYLGREGAVELHRSERYFGDRIEPEALEAFAEGWGFPARSASGRDRTSHFVVSFPAGTAPDAAERAGRAWAEEMFASGRFGDVWDYYTAFHTDTANPHLHVVVNRRGLEEGRWLKVSKRSAVTFDVLREVQVETAEAEGIVLEASARLARGLHALAPSDVEIRRAAREARSPAAPEHTPETAIRAAAAMIHYARRFEADAALVRERHPELAERLAAAAQAVKTGLALAPDPGPHADAKEIAAMSEAIERRRAEIMENFGRIDAEIGAVSGPERVRLERSAAEIKAEAAALLPDREELQEFRRVDGSGRYRGTIASDGRAREIAAEADDRVRALAQAAGQDAEVIVERYAGGPTSAGLVRVWERAEFDAARGQGIAAPKTAVRDMHRELGRVYADTQARIAEHERRKEAVREAVREIEGEGAGADRAAARLAPELRRLLSREEGEQVARGDAGPLAEIADDPAMQRRLARAYAEAVAREAAAERGGRARGRDEGFGL